MLQQQLRSGGKLLSALLISGALSLPAFAENAQREVDVSVSTQTAGQTDVQEQSFVIDKDASIHDILIDMGLKDELESLQKGEQLEITIKRTQADTPVKEINLDFSSNIVLKDKAATEETAFLGVQISSQSGPNGNSVYVENTIPGTGAADAEILPHDIILSIDGTPATSVGQAVGLIQANEPGEEIEVVVERNGEIMNITAVLGSKRVSNRDDYRHILKERIRAERLQRALRPNQPVKRSVFSRPNAPFLGVYVSIPDNGAQGVLIKNTIAGTTSEEIGLQSGDIVTGINGKNIANGADLKDVLNSLQAGDEIRVEYKRDGQTKYAQGAIGVDTRDMFAGTCPPKPEKERTVTFTISASELSSRETETMENVTGESFAKSSSDAPADMFYPNPNSGVFTINHAFDESGDVKIQVFDGRGTEVYTESVSDFSGKLERTLDISEFGSGTYFVRLEQNERVYTQKIVATK